MTKTLSARTLLAAANASLVLWIVGLVVWALARGAYADGARPPDAFSPLAYPLETSDRQRADMSLVWQQLDRPAPTPPPPPPAVLQTPKVEVVFVSIDAVHPDRSLGIVKNELGVQQVVEVGQRLGEQVVERIVVVDDAGVRYASIVFEGGGLVGFTRDLELRDRSGSRPSAPGP